MAVSGRSGRVGGLLFRTHSHSPLLCLATTTAEPRRVAAVDVRIDVLGSLRAEPDAVCHRSRASSPAGYINNVLSFFQQSGKTVEAVEFDVASATDRNDPK